MTNRFLFILAGSLFALGTYTSCKHEPPPPKPADSGSSNYPSEVGKILANKCATAGCHNQTSYAGAGGLLLDSLHHLLDGGSNGAVIVPHNPENSSLLYFINTNPTLGNISTPTMPVNGTPLTEEEYLTIRNWVLNGAPYDNGVIPFTENADTRQKIYLTQQGCDLIAVIDAERKVVMRYIPIGMSPAIESPHCVRVTEDGRYAYVSFLGSNYVQKIDTRTDTVVASGDIGQGSWNILQLPPNPADNRLILADFNNKRFVMVNTQSMTMDYDISLSSTPGIASLHGIATNKGFDTFYITMQYGNTVLKLWTAPSFGYKKISIDGNPATATTGTNTPDPHEIIMNPERTRYFLSCEKSNEIRVMDPRADTLIKAIPVGATPQELAISRKKPYLFVTCMEDDSQSPPGYKGAVYIINYETLEVVKSIYGKFYQPHAITVDDRNDVFYIASRNSNPTGPAPHHASSCSGRNGWYNVYNLNTLEPYTGKRFEVTVEPYFADTRFK